MFDVGRIIFLHKSVPIGTINVKGGHNERC